MQIHNCVSDVTAEQLAACPLLHVHLHSLAGFKNTQVHAQAHAHAIQIQPQMYKYTRYICTAHILHPTALPPHLQDQRVELCEQREVAQVERRTAANIQGAQGLKGGHPRGDPV